MRRRFPPLEKRHWQAEVREAVDNDAHAGRVERRRLFATDRVNPYLDWPGVGQVCRVDRTVTEHGKTTHETAYAITSLTAERADVRALLRLWRGHWSIENKLHYVRDVTLGEDACRVSRAHAPQVMAAMRNTVLAILTARGTTNRAAAIRKLSWNSKLASAAVGVQELT